MQFYGGGCLKKLICVMMIVLMMVAMLQGCGSKAGKADNSPSRETSGAEVPETGITAEMAFEGVNNYCHSHYDWSIAEENPDIMYVRMGEESDTSYQVIFRSYTGSFVYFTVDKASGMTTMKEVVPNLGVESDAGEFSLYDYLNESD